MANKFGVSVWVLHWKIEVKNARKVSGILLKVMSSFKCVFNMIF